MHVLLSASVPLPTRDREFFDTADVVAIRDAVKALVLAVAGRGVISFGGHPAITPLISTLMQGVSTLHPEEVRLYQSNFFANIFPVENYAFISRVVTDTVDNDREKSLLLMRTRMVEDRPLDAAVFIGGMEGVVAEYELVKEKRPNLPCFPIASTGGAALSIFNSGEFGRELLQELTYPTLFRHMLESLPP